MLQTAGAKRKQAAAKRAAAQGLKGLIVKRRWAGMEQDVEQLCHELETVAPDDCVPPGPAETD